MTAIAMWVCAAAAVGPFEGVLEYDLRVRNAQGSVKTYVSAAGVRSEASLPFGSAKNDVTVLVKASEPNVSRVWSAEKKEFVPQAPQPQQLKVVRSEALGDASVAGVAC